MLLYNTIENDVTCQNAIRLYREDDTTKYSARIESEYLSLST